MNNAVNKIIYIIVIFSALGYLSAQDTLTLKKAIEIALENNYSIKIARNDALISANNNTLGGAGALPSITASGYNSNQFYNTFSKNSQGISTEVPNVSNHTYNFSAQLDWTLFDGFSMFTTKEKLNELEKYGKVKSASAIENTVFDVISNYFRIVSLENTIQTTREIIMYSLDRKLIAEQKGEIGSGSRINLLQSMVDLNADSSRLISQESSLSKAKSAFNNILGRDPRSPFNVNIDIEIRNDLNYADLETKVKSQNKLLVQARINRKISEYTLDQAKSKRYPSLNFFTGYYYSNIYYGTGSTIRNRTNGPAFGLSAQYTLFDGFNIENSIQNAEIEVSSSHEYEKQAELAIMASLSAVMEEYSTSMKLIKFEESNLDYARQNAELAFEKYRAGAISDLELRDIEIKLVDAKNRIITARFAAKAAETELLRLSGELMK